MHPLMMKPMKLLLSGHPTMKAMMIFKEPHHVMATVNAIISLACPQANTNLSKPWISKTRPMQTIPQHQCADDQ